MHVQEYLQLTRKSLIIKKYQTYKYQSINSQERPLALFKYLK